MFVVGKQYKRSIGGVSVTKEIKDIQDSKLFMNYDFFVLVS